MNWALTLSLFAVKIFYFSKYKISKICLRKPEYCVVMADNVLLISIIPVPANRL